MAGSEEIFTEFESLLRAYWKLADDATEPADPAALRPGNLRALKAAQARLSEKRREVVRAIPDIERAAIETRVGFVLKDPFTGIPINLLQQALAVEHPDLEGVRQLVIDVIDRCIGATRAQRRRPSAGNVTQGAAGSSIFIGHGRSNVWRELKEFIKERLGLNVVDYNAVSTAGMARQERLQGMLDQAAMAFLVMTAEDERPDGKLHARENVVHEVGLFQGRLGFQRAIVLLEEGCAEFSNIVGLDQIRFPKGNVAAGFEDVRAVLKREGLGTAKG